MCFADVHENLHHSHEMHIASPSDKIQVMVFFLNAVMFGGSVPLLDKFP